MHPVRRRWHRPPVGRGQGALLRARHPPVAADRIELGESVRATIVAWITPGQVKQLAEAAPDLWAWRSALLDFGNAAESPSEVHRHSLDLGLAVIGDRRDRMEEIDAYLKTVSEPRSKDAGLMLEAAEILESVGALDAAMLQAEAALSTYQQTDDARGAVLAKGRIADILCGCFSISRIW